MIVIVLFLFHFKCFLHVPTSSYRCLILILFENIKNHFDNFQLLSQFCFYFGKPRLKVGLNNFFCSSLYLRWNVLKISYTMNQQLSLPCIQLAKLKSCSVWRFSENNNNNKKPVVTWGHGTWGIWPSPGRRSCPNTPLQKQKWQKSAVFGFLYFCPLKPSPLPPHPNKK